MFFVRNGSVFQHGFSKKGCPSSVKTCGFATFPQGKAIFPTVGQRNVVGANLCVRPFYFRIVFEFTVHPEEVRKFQWKLFFPVRRQDIRRYSRNFLFPQFQEPFPFRKRPGRKQGFFLHIPEFRRIFHKLRLFQNQKRRF